MKLTGKSLFLICLLTTCFLLEGKIKLFAAPETGLDGLSIEFPSTEMTLKRFLDVLIKHPEITVVYGSNNLDTDLELKIKLSKKKLKLKEALDEVEKQAPLQFVFNNNHIIVKRRNLEKGYKVSGTLRDKATNEPLIAADVVIDGTTTGVVTNINGNFSIMLAPGTYPFVFSYMGYHSKKQTVNIYNDINLNIYLEVKQHEIGPVNVQGNFSLIENMEVGRTIEKLDAKIVGKLNTNDINDALHGRLNGVWTTKVSGAPGDHNKIRIRGISSFFGATDPLYVVDGAIIPIVNFHNLGISDLNAHDVESVTVLKDASSNSLYGNLGSNGVIVIETKKGGGKQKFEFKVKQGFQTFNKRYGLMGAEEFLSTLDSADHLLGTDFYTVNKYKKKYELYPRYRDTLGNAIAELDYQDELFKTGSINEYQLSATGSVKTIDYYLSGNYYNHNGVITNTNYNKYTFTANLSKVVEDKYSVRLMYKGSHQENKNTLDNYLGNKTILKGINYEPAFVATPDSFLEKTNRLFLNNTESITGKILGFHTLSPDSLYYNNDKIKTENVNSINLQGYYKINSRLSLRGSSSLSFRNLVFTSNNISINLGKQFMQSSEKYTYFNAQLDLNYKVAFNGHQFNSFVRYRAYADKVLWKVDSIYNVNYDGIRPEDEIYLRGSQAIYGEQAAVNRSIHTGIFNVTYNYKNKYFISGILNYEGLKEGSSLRNSELFKSIAINYDLSKEKILHFPGWVDAFNIYVNWGESGNYPLNSLSDNLFSANSEHTANNEIVPGVYISNIGNKVLRPEMVSEIDYGMKISLFKNRLMISGDYFVKENSNLLIKRTIPLYYGGGYIFWNIGEMKNTGYELSLEALPIRNKTTYWSTKFGFSTNKQYITKLDDGAPLNFNSTDLLIPEFTAKEDQQLGDIYGYEYVGLWKDFSDEKYGLHPDYITNNGLAYARRDTVVRNFITEKDIGIIGNSLPDFTFNWINYFEYKNFSVEMLWYGSVGVDKYNATKASTFITGLNPEVRNFVLDTLKSHMSDIIYESSYFVEDASFVRLKTLSFTYRQPQKIMGKIGLEYTLSFENLITLTKYTGYDPETAIYTDNNFTDNAIDRGAYPNPRGVFFTINLSF